jgi:methionine salvage enolase-phosphatase E1
LAAREALPSSRLEETDFEKVARKSGLSSREALFPSRLEEEMDVEKEANADLEQDGRLRVTAGAVSPVGCRPSPMLGG